MVAASLSALAQAGEFNRRCRSSRMMMKPCGAQVSNSVDGARSWYRLIGQRNGIVVDLLKKLTPTGLVAQVNPTAFD